MKLNVLMVEDSLSARLDLQSVLEPHGFDVTACATIAEARSAFGRRGFDLLLVDANLPDGNGMEWVESLRISELRDRIPVLAISATCDVASRVAAIRAGASDFVGKPYAPAYVLRRVIELTQGRGQRAPGPGRVLIVDDSMTYGHALADEVRRDGHDVVIAASGEEALDYLRAQEVDCVLLDLFMPGMDGVDVCRQLRSRPAMRAVPILMLTGRKDSTVKEAAFEAGVDEFAVKTHDVATLRERVAKLLLRVRNAGQRLAPTAPEMTEMVSPSSGSAFFEQVVAASGLSEVLGASVIQRACERVGLRPDEVSPATLGRALPEIDRRLRLFLSPMEALTGLNSIAALAREATSARPRGRGRGGSG